MLTETIPEMPQRIQRGARSVAWQGLDEALLWLAIRIRIDSLISGSLIMLSATGVLIICEQRWILYDYMRIILR